MYRRDPSRSNSSIHSFIAASRKTRKRGCSSSSSCSSSLARANRFKKPVVATPSWRQLWSPKSPKYSPAAAAVQYEGKESRPVSARKLAATLWEMNEVPSPAPSARRGGSKERRSSTSFPSHLSDPSHSPNSERMEISRPGSVRRRSTFTSNKLESIAGNRSKSSVVETLRRSSIRVKDQLKDVSNALVTSKELLKIVNHVWGREDQSSSSASLVSALHAELERAGLQVSQLIQEGCSSGETDVSILMARFAKERAAWKRKQREVVEAAVHSIARELEGERKLRRRFENLNKKLGCEIATLKAALQESMEDLECEKKTRQILEQVCDELAGNIDEDKAQLETIKRESEKAVEEVEKEREMLRVADLLRKEQVQMKLSEAKHQFEEKNAAVVKLKRQFEILLNPQKSKGQGGNNSQGRLHRGSSVEIDLFLDNIRLGSHDHKMEENDGNVEDSADSEIHSAQLDANDPDSCKTHSGSGSYESNKLPFDEGLARRSISGRRPSRSSSLQKSMQGNVQNLDHEFERGQSSGYHKRFQACDFGDPLHRYRSSNVARDLIHTNYHKESPMRFVSPVRQWGQVRPPKDPHHAVSEMHSQLYSSGSRSRLSDARSEIKSRRSKR